MSKRFTKRSRALILSATSLVAVIGVLIAVLWLLPAAQQEELPPEVDTSVVLWSKGGAVDITTIAISKGEESYALTAGEGYLYNVEGYEDLPLDDPYILETVEYLKAVTAARLVVQSTPSPADFGFESDTTTRVKVDFSDNTSHTFEIGNVDPSGAGYYFRMADKPEIYLMDSSLCEALTADKKKWLSYSPITAPESASNDDDEISAVRDVMLSGTVRPQPIQFEAAPPVQSDEDALIITGYVIRKPYFHTVDKDTPLLRATTFSEMTAADVVMIRPTAADLKQYGLTDAYSVCEVNLALKKYTNEKDENGKEIEDIIYHTVFNYTIKLGNKDENGNYYGVVYAEDTLIPIVYLFEPSAVEWAEHQFEDVADDMLFYQYIYNVNSLSVTANGKTTTFALTHDLKKEDDNEKLKVTAGGKTYDTSSFRSIYASMMGIYRIEQSDETPTGNPALVIQYSQKAEFGGTVRIEIYEYTAGRYLTVHSTGEKHLVSAQVVQQFLLNYERFLNGESIT